MNYKCQYLIMAVLLLVTIQVSEGQIIEQGSSPETVTFVQAYPVDATNRTSSKLSRMSLMLDAGYNWRTAKISDDLNDFQKHLVKQIKSGFQWNGSWSYYFGKKKLCGVGLKFQQFLVSNETYGEDRDTGKTGVLRFADRITYIGPAYMMQLPLGKSNFLFDICGSIGYIGYKSKQSFVDEKVTVSGATVGVHSAVGLSYKITSKWAIGCKMSATNGALFEYTLTDMYGQKTTEKFGDNSAESLAQLSISFGIRHYIN